MISEIYVDGSGVVRHDASGFYAKVVLDSLAPCGRRLCSVEAKYWRAIHSEIMTHRDCARNAASSRAIPWRRVAKAKLRDIPANGTIISKGQFAEIGTDLDEIYDYVVGNCTVSYVGNSPFIPVFIGTEQKGMQSGSEIIEPNRSAIIECIKRMKDFCLTECNKMYELGAHKSIINRYVEPWSYITILRTATEWKNFYRLRVHPKAEKHFNFIATMMKLAMNNSVPRRLREGEWHLPYLREEDQHDAENCLIPERLRLQCKYDGGWRNPTEVLKRVSAGRCARLSYLNQDGIRALGDDLGIFEKLMFPEMIEERDDDALHASPTEHVAEALSSKERSGPFLGWRQFRKEFANENVADTDYSPTEKL